MLKDPGVAVDVKTGQYIEYQMPSPTKIRRVFVDHGKDHPALLWSRQQSRRSIVKVDADPR